MLGVHALQLRLALCAHTLQFKGVLGPQCGDVLVRHLDFLSQRINQRLRCRCFVSQASSLCLVVLVHVIVIGNDKLVALRALARRLVAERCLLALVQFQFLLRQFLPRLVLGQFLPARLRLKFHTQILALSLWQLAGGLRGWAQYLWRRWRLWRRSLVVIVRHRKVQAWSRPVICILVNAARVAQYLARVSAPPPHWGRVRAAVLASALSVEDVFALHVRRRAGQSRRYVLFARR
mmetsp:Transcript_3901/g.10320  ORF Transcript_3901/g.10320 Transcript_3901/m.10320 type:complete len:235 (+) Transcript_3901:316-1020(+)